MLQRSMAVSIVVLGMSWAAGCTTLPWGNGGLGDEVPAEAIDPNGLVRVLGPSDLVAAAARLTNLIPVRWADGLTIEGLLSLDAGGASIDAMIDGVVIEPGPVQLALGSAGLAVSVGVTIAPAPLADRDATVVLCAPKLSADGALLAFDLGLVTDKLGRVQAVLVGEPRFEGAALSVDWSGCGDVVVATALDELTDELWGALADVTADAIAPDLLLAVPPALGLDLATGIAGTVAADAMGSGYARLSVAADEADGDAVWRSVGDVLVVPFGVGITADTHPCMPALVLPRIGVSPLPGSGSAEPGTALLSAAVVRQAITAGWLAGAACGSHATRGVEVPAEELAAMWPALGRLPAATPLSLQVWPREAPSVGLAIGGADRLVIGTGLVDIDLYAELDGAQVRLASMTIDADTVLGVRIGATGLVTLAPSEVTLRASGARAGLLAAPPLDAAEALLRPVVLALLDGRPLLSLPARPATTGSTRVRVTAEHIVVPM
ncbi:MAG: hypothetical protein CVU56_00260 [Deltaproteobacteria bacterium HGW-Deltaproteobacteria-14]|jgi:hypothetical protein|nr:MAG: hypothetical protein CVU56_00260 [Deltaproteobacteria bacterium HGW-Deltaproteobacteria-14]